MPRVRPNAPSSPNTTLIRQLYDQASFTEDGEYLAVRYHFLIVLMVSGALFTA
jgi:hypothetical protein